MLAAPAFAASPITGRWLTTDGSAVVAIAPCGAALCGRIAKLNKAPANGPAVDANNPDPKLKTRPLVGMPILTGLMPSGDGWKGKIYDPKKGKTYSATVTRDGAKLKIQACVAVFCQTIAWTAA
jgi:uncharacterized protein (DUF2147 family)